MARKCLEIALMEEAPNLKDAWIEQALYNMDREIAVHRAPATADKMTVKKRDKIKEIVADNPHLAFREVGRMVNTDMGRVSDVMHGKWDWLTE